VTDGWTYGVELEWPDVDVRTELPDEWAWSATDYTVVSSDGIANDPKRELILHGGELNSPVCRSPEELSERSLELAELLRPGRNYRSNLHIHLAMPELENLELLKQAADFTWRELPRTLEVMDPLRMLLNGLTDTDEIAGAEKRMAHSARSRHYFTSRTRHLMRMQARSREEFLRAEVPLRKRDGAPQWQLAPREAVNFRSLRKHGTVEFRFFAGDDRGHGVRAAASFARDWMRCACEDNKGFEVPYWDELPVQLPFELRLERGWAWTNLQHNSRDTVRQRLADMGKLDACT
jgi:hypothetical protein